MQRRRLPGAKIKRLKIRHCMIQNKRGKRGGRMMREGVAEQSTNLGRTRNERGGIRRKTLLFHSCPSGRVSPQRKDGKGKIATNLVRYLLLITVILVSLDFRRELPELHVKLSRYVQFSTREYARCNSQGSYH